MLPLDIPLLLLAASTTTATLLLLLLLLPLAVLRPVPGPRNAIQGCVLSLNTPTCERPHRPEPRRVELLFLDVATTAALPLLQVVPLHHLRFVLMKLDLLRGRHGYLLRFRTLACECP